MGNPHLSAPEAQAFHLGEHGFQTLVLPPALVQLLQGAVAAGFSHDPDPQEAHRLGDEGADPSVLRQIVHRLQERTYTTQRAYDYFCGELEHMLLFVFGLEDDPTDIGSDSSDEKTMLRNCIIAVTHKIYLEKFIRAVAAEQNTRN